MTRLAARLIASGAALLAFFIALGIAVNSGTAVDRFVADALDGQSDGVLGRIAQVGSALLGPTLAIAAAILLLGWTVLAWRRGQRELAGVLVRVLVLLGVCRAVSLFKEVYERVRPQDYPGWSFPSGHVVSVAAVAVTACVLCRRLWPHRFGTAVVVWSSVAIALAALCRLVLDVHWLTDTVGATIGVLGVGLLTSVALRLLPA
ncbi:undecaprenyl-diphosphatase [Herbihabitans rhizosphaerae]|uniref:Undecaprenyl-diphosphatase n=1 Tax=Herbihabitans rhizosphaerae TaxID=1872711 RepID=A0A4Q7KST5_9PSEU|nr:phosphatase PAP2 family protein [Herbihabitans rhizosphaerae]RZS38851.1 undecaprenyl-diphosphatase [Herbihabitans rhizosphaerae]